MFETISDLHNLSPRFFRSTDLIADYDVPNSLDSYFLTPHAANCLSRILLGIQDDSAGRAWRITGDYGSGKSSFALFLAKLLAGQELGSKLADYPAVLTSLPKGKYLRMISSSTSFLNWQPHWEKAVVSKA
jgi:hypothetical protein